jgi:RoxA-like, cytochrome c-like
MRQAAIKILAPALCALFTITVLIGRSQAQKNRSSFAPVIPKTWDEKALARLAVPLAEAAASPAPVSADYYYRMPVRPVYKSYPVYAPGKEPPGYFESLKQREPEVVFDPGKLQTGADWIGAGELVFDAPTTFDAGVGIVRVADVRNPQWYEKTGMPTARHGVLPFTRYVIRKKGQVEMGNFSCGMCHTRVMPDGSVIKGAQGNFPFDRVIAFLQRTSPMPEEKRQELQRSFIRLLFAAPWLSPDPQARAEQMPLQEIISIYDAIPPGVLARNGTSPFSPVQVPDLIGTWERRYLDHSGLVVHRGIDDLMRYAALNQDGDLLARYGEFRPIEVVSGKLPDPSMLSRYSDEQLYALALYIYSLTPPSNPNKRTPLTARGETIFRRAGCTTCHTPPLYTNNKLTPAEGFKVPDDHQTRFDILPLSVGTDPTLTLTTRRGTGYYKVPSLKGVWYRGPFEHNGSVATLEDWFDPRRLRDDYVPTGWKGAGVKTRAVKGHEFGLKLSAEEKRALIAFLRTL